MSSFFRIVAIAAWALAFGLSTWLAVEFHDYQPGIALGVGILSLILSAFGLMMARHCGQQRDRVAMSIGCVLWAAGAIAFAITEIGFWSGSYKERHAEYVQVKAAKTRQEGMKDIAWEAVKTGETRASTAELQSRLRAAQQSDIWTQTASCTTATAAKSRAFCQAYFNMEANLASAGKLEKLESQFLGEKPDAKASMVHNVFAAADLISENSNLSERQAATLVILIIALVLMLSRDLLLIVANPFGAAAPRIAAQPRKDLQPHPLWEKSKPSPVAFVETPKEAPPVSDPFPKPAPEPKPVELAAVGYNPKPTEPEVFIGVSKNPLRLVHSIDEIFDELPAEPPTKSKKNKPAARSQKQSGDVLKWYSDTATETNNPKDTTTLKCAWKSYVDYCEALRLNPVGKNKFSHIVAAKLGQSSEDGRRAKRNAQGNVFTGFLIDNRQMVPVRRRA